jgi:hypothetical protein
LGKGEMVLKLCFRKIDLVEAFVEWIIERNEFRKGCSKRSQKEKHEGETFQREN